MQSWILYLIPIAGLAGIAFAMMKASWVKSQDAGTDRMKEIAGFVQEGAMAFLRREYKVLAIFVAAVAAALAVANVIGESTAVSYKNPLIAVSFVLGAFCSGLAGWVGMRVATNANVRTTNAARTSLNGALKVAFSGGTVMGMMVVGLAVTGLGVLVLAFGKFGVVGDMTAAGAEGVTNIAHVVTVLSGFSLGASSIALFARVGGGIYTKAADVGADLVGKVEAGIPEDDPRNPAVIADNVGDNVGDVAGMGADLFESFVGSIIGTMVLGVLAETANETPIGLNMVTLPLLIAGVGILVSIGATFLVRTSEGGNPQTALNTGTFAAAGIMIPIIFGLCYWVMGGDVHFDLPTVTAAGVGVKEVVVSPWKMGSAATAGLLAGVLVGVTTEYYCAKDGKPVRRVAQSSERGSAPNIISGLALGMQSTLLPVIWIGGAILASFYLAGLYGIALAALGMLCTTGIQLAVDAYGPVADNAGGLAEMSKLPKEVRERTDNLDAVGNTTAAIGKGFAIGSAALTALALFAAYQQMARIDFIDVTDPKVTVGLLVGAMLPFLFSAMCINAVSQAADAMIDEVRRQFREIPGLLEGTATAEYGKCVDISTAAALKKMMAPGLMAVAIPVIVGFADKHALGGLLAGVTVSGVLLAIFQANAGGAWDNAKKYIEDGHHGGKGSEAHKAAVQGDTVGDPLKDTSGPSLNILIKLMSVVALVIAPLL
ncbi:MAG TPA: sodium-translocating pyrophosphatase [Kofleriaceae bacterium]|nr:sodium-translocating pyrophosphatase [Kofleriaceae bacterium]